MTEVRYSRRSRGSRGGLQMYFSRAEKNKDKPKSHYFPVPAFWIQNSSPQRHSCFHVNAGRLIDSVSAAASRSTQVPECSSPSRNATNSSCGAPAGEDQWRTISSAGSVL